MVAGFKMMVFLGEGKEAGGRQRGFWEERMFLLLIRVLVLWLNFVGKIQQASPFLDGPYTLLKVQISKALL